LAERDDFYDTTTLDEGAPDLRGAFRALVRLVAHGAPGDAASTKELLATLRVVIVPYLRAHGSPTAPPRLTWQTTSRRWRSSGSRTALAGAVATSDDQRIAWALSVAQSRS
jgi:hypothetical protein